MGVGAYGNGGVRPPSFLLHFPQWGDAGSSGPKNPKVKGEEDMEWKSFVSPCISMKLGAASLHW